MNIQDPVSLRYPSVPAGSIQVLPAEFGNEEAALAALLWEHYNIRVALFQRMRSVLGVVTADGSRYIWKELKHPEMRPRLSDWELLVHRLQAAGVRAAGPLRTLAGDLVCPSHSMNGARGYGYLQPWLQGRHVNLSDRTERLASLWVISKMHRETAIPLENVWSANLPMPSYPRRSLLSGRIHQKYEIMKQTWPELCQLVPALRSMTDALFEGAVRAQRAANGEQSETGRQLTNVTLQSWCHRDLAPHNLLFDGQSVNLIDFDLAAPDDPLGDAAQVCNHALFLRAVSSKEWREMVLYYSLYAGLSHIHRQRLWMLLSFPDALARAVTDWVKAGRLKDTSMIERALETEETRILWQAEGNGDFL